MSAGRPELLGVFEHIDALLDALHQAAHEPGVEIKDVYSPVPDHQLLEFRAPGKSPVRFFTFIGGLSGLVGGLALAELTSMIWNLIVFGKPVTDVIPFLVIGFEGTILLGALGTLTGMLVATRLPHFEFPDRAYRASFSKDQFGLWLACKDGRIEQARALLEGAGAVEVQDLAAPKADAGGAS